MEGLLAGIGIVVLLALITFVSRGLRVVQQYERGVVFRLGKIHREPLEPGLNLVNPIIDRVVKVNMQIIAMGVPAQEGITHDNISVRVDAVVYFRVIDPWRAAVIVEDYKFAILQVAQTSGDEGDEGDRDDDAQYGQCGFHGTSSGQPQSGTGC